MNVKRFTARTPREALNLVRQAFGEDAVVLSTRPSPEGVEVLAMAPESLSQIEQVRSTAPAAAAPVPVTEVQQDVEQLSMSTLSFQDYVRERMLKRRQAEAAQPPHPAAAAAPERSSGSSIENPSSSPLKPAVRLRPAIGAMSGMRAAPTR